MKIRFLKCFKSIIKCCRKKNLLLTNNNKKTLKKTSKNNNKKTKKLSPIIYEKQMKILFSFISLLLFLAIMVTSTSSSSSSTTSSSMMIAAQQQQDPQPQQLANGLYCGTSTKSQGFTTLLQIQDNLLSLLIMTYSSSSSSNTPLIGQCEMQYLLSHQYNTVTNPTPSNPNTVPWSRTKVLSEQGAVDTCANLSVSSPVLSFAPNQDQQNNLYIYFTLSTASSSSTTTVSMSQSVCDPANPISPWVPSGFYCTNIANNVGVTVGPKNSFEVDLLGLAVRGRFAINTQTGRMSIMAFGADITSLFEVSQYNSTTGLIRLEGEYEGYSIAVSGGRSLCAKPDSLNNNVNLIKNGSYCGTTQDDYIGLTLLEGHLFVLNYGGICSATGYYTETLMNNGGGSSTSTSTTAVPQLTFFFTQFSDCIQNVSITSATSSLSPYTSLSVSFFGGNSINPQEATLTYNNCENVPFTLLNNAIIPNGLYCLAPSFANQYLPGGNLGVAIFGDATTRQRYQIWAGACEAHGWFTVDGATGIATMHEHVQSSSCPVSDEIEVVGVKWSAFSGSISVSVKYQSMVVTVTAEQGNCPRNTPSGVINALPSGLYCNSSDATFPSVTVLGDAVNIAVSDSCSAHGSYIVNTNGQVTFTMTSLSDACNDFFVHTLTFTSATPLAAGFFNFQGFYNNNSLIFNAANCSHPARQTPLQMTTLCFRVTDSSDVQYWGFALLGKTYARFTLGTCVINADFQVSAENQIMNYKVSSSTAECNGLKMQLLSFATDGSDSATVSVSGGSNIATQQVTANRQCPTTLTTTTTTVTRITSTSSLPVITTAVPPPAPPTQTPQPSTSAPTSAPSTSTAPSSSSPSTQTPPNSNTPVPPSPPTTTTLPPTLPLGTYNFETSNSLSGSLTVSPTSVVLAVGDCSEGGSLVAQTQNQNNFDFISTSKSAGCSTTQLSSVTFSKQPSDNNNNNNNGNQLTFSANINGQSFSAPAVPQNSQTSAVPAPAPSSSSPIGAAVGGAIGGVILLAIVAVLYMRKKSTSGSTGIQDHHHTTKKFSQVQNRDSVNEEMLANAVSNYQNFDERFSTQGQNDQTVDI